jgi:single-strand DNA-binding protein
MEALVSDIYVTLSGNVTDDPRQYTCKDGTRVTSMRLAVNRRVLDQQTNTWQTRETTFYTVRCYRGLADNTHQSIGRGHPVVVYGKLRIRRFERDEEQRFWAEVEAISVGHDLRWGIATFEKPVRLRSAPGPDEDDRQGVENTTREWELAHARSGGAGGVGEAREAGDGERDEDWPVETVPMAA